MIPVYVVVVVVVVVDDDDDDQRKNTFFKPTLLQKRGGWSRPILKSYCEMNLPCIFGTTLLGRGSHPILKS